MKFARTFGMLALACVAALAPAVAPAGDKAEILSVQKIWDSSPHSAFTDLIFHNNQWICVFREGKGHVSPDGALQVLTSPDFEKWTSAAVITSPDEDLRDAKITLAPNGDLMLCGAGAFHDKSRGAHQSYIWYARDPANWGEKIAFGDKDFWLWRVTWHDGKAYSLGYATGANAKRSTRLYRSEDGKKFDVLVPTMNDEGYPNESSIVFQPDGTALCLVRRDDKTPNAMLGTAKAPYTEWGWKTTDTQVGGPQMIRLKDGRLIVGGRRYPGGARTVIWELNPETAALTELAVLPSGGDNSYPGLVEKDGLLWVSYYSSHEDPKKSRIYTAKLRLPEKK